MDKPIKSVPGTETFLRRRDLPEFCRSGDDLQNNLSIQLFKTESQENSRAHGLILNTYEELDGTVLSHMRKICPNLYTIGPLHAHLKTKQTKISPTCFSISTSSSLLKEDMSCLTWLDAQPSKSVIYVSFGSIVTLTKQQLMEFWHGLVNSGSKFLWVIRPDTIINAGGWDWEISEGTKERGGWYIVEWAPQEKVLEHEAIGGFLTHSGWNSCLGSIYAGVPMICWPYFVDQQVNSRFVSEVWKIGLDMKDVSCDRVVVEKMVRELMAVRKDEFLKRADEMAKLARACLDEGGSSYSNLQRLVRDIYSFTTS